VKEERPHEATTMVAMKGRPKRANGCLRRERVTADLLVKGRRGSASAEDSAEQVAAVF
jgi:hypothetical protein